MPGGRPTKYSGNMCRRARHYLANFQEFGDPIPSIAGLACALDITRETVRDWTTDENKSEFSAIVEKILATQEKTLLAGGLNNDMNASISKLILSKHGYSDKQQIDKTGDQTLNINVVSE